MRPSHAKIGLLSLVTVSTVLVSACTAAPPATAPANTSGAAGTDVPVSAAPLAPSLSVTDPNGQNLTLPKIPERIVCLTGLCDDALTELGLKPAGSSNAVLLTLPQIAGEAGKSVPVVPGSFGQEDVEAIGALKPDLVIGLSGVHDGLRPAVTKFNAPLWTVNPNSWEQSVGYLRNLGALTGRTEQAVAAETKFRTKLAKAIATSKQKGLHKQTVLLMFGSADSIGVDTADSINGKLLGQLFGYPFPAKGTNAETANTYSVEEILAKQPTVVFVYSLIFAASDKKLSEQLAANPVWKQVKAVQSGQVHEVVPKLWGSGRGTRSLGAIIDEAIAKVSAAPAA
ncbi:ABC transporter substrate-binding protein [Crossiella cryophila]|uniref:Iron complex transport system substrate-binding protein n=1 Tax=Crossiella cryophila TaxID=43355 RepID=A0A7W7FS75_9PSEU|nr:ABC transporter substrate-binding protein [Crossiella cryophila]MBB4675128.1 iron complex transport system substrate-binding protein [Crossiella cryophila]